MGSSASLSQLPSPSGALPFPELVEDELAPGYFPQDGVSVRFLQDFILQCDGGRDGIKELTTTDLCEKMVKPITAPYKLSFCDLMKQIQHKGVGKATVFISHAWKYKFVDLVDALVKHFSSPGNSLDTIVWFDVFSVNQHRSGEKDFTWWSGTFQEAIRQFGRTVMVLSPWQDPIPLTRAWCLWELYSTVITGCVFEVALSDHEEESFFQDIDKDTLGSLNAMKGKIDVARSECWIPDDREKIFTAIQQQTTFYQLNAVIFKCFRHWMTTLLENNVVHLRSTCGTDDMCTLQRQHILASLYRSQGQLPQALSLYEQCYEDYQRVLGERHPDTLSVMFNLAGLYQSYSDAHHSQNQHDNHSKALSLLERCYELSKEVLGREHSHTLAMMNTLAKLYQDKGQLPQAAVMFTECYGAFVRQCGENHPDTCQSLHSLAGIYKAMQDYDRALSIYEDCRQRMVASPLLGEHHPMTLSVTHNLATLYKAQGKMEESLKLFEHCYTKFRSILGEEHPNTLSALSNLAALCHAEGKFDQALLYGQRSFEQRKSLLGENHPSTLVSMSNLAAVYLALSEQASENENAKSYHDIAVNMYKDCYCRFQQVYGDSHPYTLSVKEALDDIK